MLISQRLSSRGILHGFLSASEVDMRLNDGLLTLAEQKPIKLVLPKQVHGTRVVQPRQLRQQPADGLWRSGSMSSGMGVRSADCIPALLTHRSGAVAAIHAGWRGVDAAIVERFLLRVARYGYATGGWLVALGPAAGGCCYEVGSDVASLFGLPAKQQNLDLRAVLARRLKQVGVGAVELVGGCTICDPNWASYRRQKQRAGRNIAFIR